MLAGAHNTIVTARAGKDLVSCLVSGLLTIGPRFGGAVDDAARYFQDACDRGTRDGPQWAPPLPSPSFIPSPHFISLPKMEI